MNEVMTMTEIEKQFDKEWVLLEDPVLDEHRQVAGGKLLFHSKHRDEVYQAAMRIRPKHAAFLFTGPIQEEQNLLRQLEAEGDCCQPLYTRQPFNMENSIVTHAVLVDPMTIRYV